MDSLGRNFRVSVFGESHGPAVGVVLDGVRAGLPLTAEDFKTDLLRRKSGAAGTTPRIENDLPEILSGVFDGRATGTPITIIFRNENTRSGDYAALQDLPRPGHADYTARVKWKNFNDPRGGGHFSGRLTLPIVAAGVVAKKMCAYSFTARLIEVGGCKDPDRQMEAVAAATREGDSLGGIVECRIDDVPAGLGEPFFDSVESLLAHAVFAIPGVRGIEFGDGFQAARMKGSEHNDPFACIGETVKPAKDGAGGINGGITNGGTLVFRVAFKPTSSIAKEQRTLNLSTGAQETLRIPGRHDTCFALRAPVIVEAMAAIVLADLQARFVP